MLFTILLAVILSIDCLGVGLAYGMRHVVLPWYGRVIISCCSGIAIAVSMCLGRLLEGIIPGEQIHLFGESMLVCLGVFFLVRSIMELRKERVEKLCTDETDSACVSETPLFQWRVPGLDVMIKIMNNPQHADLDHSGQINSKEAVWLGFALAMDSFGAGVCIALMGFSVLWVSICTLSFAFLLVSAGYIWGGRAGEVPQYRKLNLLPGIMLITLGMIRILFI
ncbi:MAG: sporulation membrane protein YtaF [Peptococcaceae bacterium]|nr:sporulation membrane protein YtaF [Peptococcaceae bacterium]